MKPSKTATTFARAALLGLVGFVLAVVVAGAVTPGYRPVVEYISALAARTSPHPWIMTAGFVCLAASTIAAAVAVRARLAGTSGLVGALLLGLAGLGIVGAAVFRLDCSPTAPACAALEEAGRVSGQHLLHDLVSLASHLLLVAGYLVLHRAVRRSRALARLAGPTLLIGLAAMAFVVGLVIFDYGQVGGLVQRVAVVVMYGWAVWLANAPATPAPGPLVDHPQPSRTSVG